MNRMLINATVADELRVAVVQDGELVDLDIETSKQSSIKGNIYKGVVHNVEGSLAAAFIDFGEHKQGFLPFDEIADSQFYREWKSKDAPRITDVIKRGQDIVVQVDKDAVGDKGAALTTYLSLAGRFSVLMPGSDARGVSRKISDESDRKKLKAMAAKITVPKDCGYIVRTAGLGQTKTAIQRDLDRLVEVNEKLEKAAKIARAPSQLYKEPDVIGRTLRDLFNDDIDEVWIDSRDEYEAAKEYFEELMPDMADRIKHHENPIPIFAYYDVESQIEATFARRVETESGGSIVIDRTEALVAIDVNSGKITSERDHEDTVYKTNFEAAHTIARQLRLRDLGGIIVVDFIDMELDRNRRAVVKALKDASKSDKARIKVSRITSNGLCILTRQRIRAGVRKSFQRRCQVCDGTGWIRTPESHSLSLLKRIETRLAQGGVGEARVKTHRETAEYILNRKRSELYSLEQQYNCAIIISAKANMDRDADDVTFLSMGEVLAEITDRLPNREELRKKRASGSRKRTRKKKASKKSEAAASAKEKGETKKRRKRKKATEEAAAVDASNGPLKEAVPEPAVPGGPTFTGKPSPEMLEKLKAQRKARKEARAARKAAQANWVETTAMDSSPPAPAEPEAPAVETDAAPTPEPEAPKAKPKRKSRAKPKPKLVEEVVEEAAPAPEPVAPDAGDGDAVAAAPDEEAPKPGILSRLLGRKKSSAPPPEEETG